MTAANKLVNGEKFIVFVQLADLNVAKNDTSRDGKRCFPIIAPLYWWKQFDTYKVGTVTDSCSTMHKIAEQEFTLDDFSCEHLFNGAEEGTEFLKDFMYTIKALNKARETYLETKKNIYWWQMIQLLPSSYNQRRTVVLNYEVLRNACQARKHHKLDEWFGFYKWAESLPYSELILEV